MTAYQEIIKLLPQLPFLVLKDIERIGRKINSLPDEWILCAADAADPNVMNIEFGKKGPRGAWLNGRE